MSSNTAGLLRLIGLPLLTRGSVNHLSIPLVCCNMGIPGLAVLLSISLREYLKPAWPILYGCSGNRLLVS